MKTGRLLKFSRQGTDIHAYLYRDGVCFRAAVYVRAAGAPESPKPLVELEAKASDVVERDVRAWIDQHYPPRPSTR